jgi:hypothetical protein
MIGKRTSQQALFDVGNVFDLSLSSSSFHGQLARVSDRLFKDEDFAALYSDRVGRPSVPPSLLALLVLLQGHAQVSSEEAIERSAYDLRWAAVLRRPAGAPLCARSTLELFWAHLILHDQVRDIFQASLKEAKRAGLLSSQALRIAVDTKPILGRGAVLDTYNLLAAGIVKLARAFARQQNHPVDQWLSEHDLNDYSEPSIKGAADIDWSDADARDQFLTKIVADARRLLAQVDASEASTKAAASLLEQLLLQDIATEGGPDGGEKATIIQGKAPGRIPSVTDPAQRHGRKSKQHRFTGHKASIAVDIDSGLIVAAEVLSGDAPDDACLMDLVKQAEQNSDLPVAETIGDCAYGNGANRQAFADADRKLFAKVPQTGSGQGLFPKSVFQIDLLNNTVTCPGGETTDRSKRYQDGLRFDFGSLCSGCTLRSQCTNAKDGRTVRVHPQEALLKEAREYSQTSEGRKHLRERLIVENRLGRLAQLGIGQARYRGHKKTRFQLLIAATVANLRRTWNWEDAQNGDLFSHHLPSYATRSASAHRFNNPSRYCLAIAA